MSRRQVASLTELEKPCPNPSCGHQCAVHTGGADASGWALYEPVWANATGWCSAPDCGCQSRTTQGRAAV